MKTGTGRHPKIYRLMQSLKINRREAIGLVNLLWEFASEYSPDGDLTRWGTEMISGALDWPAGRTEELIDGLLLSGWLDRSGLEGRLVVHDWENHCPEYIKKRILRKRKTTLQNDVENEKRPPTSDIVRTTADNGGQRPLSLVQSSPTQPSQESPPARAREGPEISPELETAAMRVFGGVPLMQLSEWLEKYGQEWVLEALRRTEIKKAGIPYCRGVLEGFARDGGPKRNDSTKRDIPGRSESAQRPRTKREDRL